MGLIQRSTVFAMLCVLVAAAGATSQTRDLLQTNRGGGARNQVASITTSNQINQAVRAVKAGAPAQAATRAATGTGTAAVNTIASRTSGLPIQTAVKVATPQRTGRHLMQGRNQARTQVASMTTSNQINQAVLAAKAGAPAKAATKAATGSGTAAVTTIASRTSGLPIQTAVKVATPAPQRTGRHLMQTTGTRNQAANQIAQATTASKINQAVLAAKAGTPAKPATKAATRTGTAAVTAIARPASAVPLQTGVMLAKNAGK